MMMVQARLRLRSLRANDPLHDMGCQERPKTSEDALGNDRASFYYKDLR